MAEISDEVISRVLSRFDSLQQKFETLQETLEESRRETVHMSACYQEQAARLDEFMKDHEARVRFLESNCPHDERWEQNSGEHSRIWNNITNLDTRMTKIERAKCPKSPTLDEIDERLEAIETVHAQQDGGKQTNRSNMEYGLALLTVLLGMLNLWQFITGI